ncbi:MAG: NUDIX hydrolase [Acidobacteria bacterium]|nr:NUDIX hydrolase [Acidobacteriota bacterium]
MKILHSGSHLDLVERNTWEFVQRRCSGVVAVVAITAAGELILIEQYREALRSKVVELPAGLVGDGEGDDREDFAGAARRELVEETGFDCDEMERIGRGPSSSGLTDEVIDFFRASAVRRIHEGGGVGDEEITVHLVPLVEVRNWLAAKEANGYLVDPKIAAGLWMSKA